jgi:hypothetical protein
LADAAASFAGWSAFNKGRVSDTMEATETMQVRRERVLRALEAAIAETQEEIRHLEAILAVKREAERLRAEWARPRETGKDGQG